MGELYSKDTLRDLEQQIILQWQGPKVKVTGYEKDKTRRKIKAGLGRSCTSYVPCQVSFLRKIEFLLVPVGKWKEMGGFYEVSSGTNSGGS